MHIPVAALAALLPVLLVALPGQAPSPADSLRSACGLQRQDGELWGVGPDFKVAFRADGVEFTPALGERAPHNLPLRLRLLGAERGGQWQPEQAIEPRASALQVRYERRGCVERYDVSAKGIAQSFVFASLPSGRGDLVVHLAVETELPLDTARADGVRFELPGVGGVAIGGVTGIDARGDAVAGTIRCDGRTIELRLPAAFVDHAALPLVLDPQIGTVFPVTNSTLDYQDPELGAPFVAGGSYLCVFERAISATDHDVRAIRLTSTGSISGSLLAVTTGTGDDENATVGSIALRSAWVVVYERAGDLFVRSVNGSGTVSPEYTAVSGANTQIEPDLGSELTMIDDDAVLVFRDSTQNAIQASLITLFSSGLLVTSAPFPLAQATSPTFVGRPRIAHSGGEQGRFLVVYPRTLSGNDSKPNLVLIDRDLTVLATDTLTNTTNDEDSADVDGNGDMWVVAFESEASEGTGDNDIVAMPVFHDEAQGTLWHSSASVVTGLLNVDEIDPAVACLRDGSCLIGWRRRAAPGSSDTEVFMQTIDQLACRECEPTVLLANSSDIETNLTAAADRLSANRGLVLWETSTSSGGNGDIDGVAWLAEDGSIVTPPGGQGCGPTLTAVGGCARVGNANFQVQVHGTDGQSVSTFVLSTGVSQILCGPCRLYADPFSGIAFYPVAGISGFASFQLSVPPMSSLRGMTFYVQWLVSSNTGACTWLNADFSNAIAITIE